MRLDKWLWAARFFKTRSLCKSAIENGKIRVNNDRPKTSRKIDIGDFISIKKSQTITIIEATPWLYARSLSIIQQICAMGIQVLGGCELFCHKAIVSIFGKDVVCRLTNANRPVRSENLMNKHHNKHIHTFS